MSDYGSGVYDADGIDLADDPEDGGNYAIYVIRKGVQKHLVDVKQDAIGIALVTLRNDKEWDDDDRVGVQERPTRKWIINPFAKGGSMKDYVSGGTAMEIELNQDEHGFEMAITNEDGTVYTFNVHLAALQLVPIGLEIANHFREGERLARQHVPPATPVDLEAYEPNDPKRISLGRSSW